MKSTNQPKNKSVINIAKIARDYMYKMQIIYVTPQIAFLSISDNYLKSPYPRHITSEIRCSKYVEKIYEEYYLM